MDGEVVTTRTSVLKLRIGISLIILFWLPFWLLEPLLSKIFGVNTAAGRHKLLVDVIIVQTILGILGILVVGKQILPLLKHKPRRRVLKSLWTMLIHGHQ